MSYQRIDDFLWSIKLRLMKKHSVDEACRIIEPLAWYITTDRAPLDFIRAMLTAKPFMICRKLEAGGSTDEVIQRLNDYLMPV